jgi:hypothetical protein
MPVSSPRLWDGSACSASSTVTVSTGPFRLYPSSVVIGPCRFVVIVPANGVTRVRLRQVGTSTKGELVAPHVATAEAGAACTAAQTPWAASAGTVNMALTVASTAVFGNAYVWWWNHQRLHGELDMRTPIEVEDAYYADLESAHPAPAGQTTR